MARDISRRGAQGGSVFDFRNEIDRLFEDFFSPGAGRQLAERGLDFVPNLEVREQDQDYLVRVDLPGMKPEDVSIDVDQNVLTVRGERKREQQETRGGYAYSEASYGSFMRSVQLPQGVDASKVEARMEHGVLEIAIPKGEEARPRKIPVRGATAGAEQVPSSTQQQHHQQQQQQQQKPQQQTQQATQSNVQGAAQQARSQRS
jgi:HSP20 family protein